MIPASSITLPLAQHHTEHVRLSVEDGVAHIVLDRPERKNPLTFESYRELTDLFQAASQDDGVKAFLLSGSGGNFCSGGDVFEIIGPLLKRDTKGLMAFTRMTGDLVKAMRACPQPIVAAVDGVCAGAGAILAMASDIRLGAEGAKVSFLFSRVGLAGCDMGACAMLPRIIGQGRAADLLYTGRSMSAAEGLAAGFFSRILEPEALAAAALGMARELAAGPTFAHAMTKRMLRVEWAMSIDDAIDAEAMAQALCMTTQDFARAFEAFSERRKPVFAGD